MTIANGAPAKFIGDNPVYNGQTCTIVESYTATTGELRYRVRWDDLVQRDLLQNTINADLLTPIIVERLSVFSVPPAVGARVRGYEIPGFTGYEGQEVVVKELTETLAFAEFKSLQKPDDTVLLGFGAYEVVSVEASKEASEETWWPVRPSQETRLIGEMRDEITALKAKITELETDNSRTNMRANTYCEDIATIGRLLLEEAERRGWCADFDDFVESVNGALTLAELPVRQEEFEIVVRGTATISWSRNVTVTAKNEEEAISMVENDPSEYMDLDEEATESASYNGFDTNEVDEVETY